MVSMKNTVAKDSEKLEVILTTEEILADPIKCKGYQQFQVINLFLDPLVRKTSAEGLISGIASKWDITSNNTEYIFHISDKALFHNEEEVTAEDVLFSFNRHLEPNSSSGIGIYLKNILDKITIIDRKTIKFKLKGPYAPFLDLIAMPGFGIISRKSNESNIIGSGPYQFKKTEGNLECLIRFPSYKILKNHIASFCFHIERDVEKTINYLNAKKIDLAMGSPLEVALSPQLENDLVDSPTFSLVTTHVFLNHSNNFLKKKENRELVRNILYQARNTKEILTKFDTPLNTFFPKGIMTEAYYKNTPTIVPPRRLQKKRNLKVVFPYGIFLESSIKKIVDSLESHGFIVDYINVKGKDLLEPILKGEFDLLFIPYQGVIPDPDGYLDLLNPKSIFSKAKLPTVKLFDQIKNERFSLDKIERVKKYEKIFYTFEKEFHIIPFSQNSIPIVYNKKIKLPDLNFSFHLNLRELELKK